MCVNVVILEIDLGQHMIIDGSNSLICKQMVVGKSTLINSRLARYVFKLTVYL